jgi:MOSC domain-containing protein YiiM
MTVNDAGLLIGIARRAKSRGPMELLEHGLVTLDSGLQGDFRGAKFKNRQITVLAREAWDAALLDLADLAGPADLPWTVRRANLLVEGVRLPRARGGVLQIGPVTLEITGQTNPCHRMEEARAGLLSALHPDWRGGVTCRVVTGGALAIGDRARVVVSPIERQIRLPG